MTAPFGTFPWPPLSESGPQPVWKGNGFEVNGTPCPVICYTEAESNWSDDLTSLHEAEAGRDHPIDIASRRLAFETLQAHCSRPGSRLLEVGSSSGYFLEELHQKLPQAEIVGSDYIAGPLRKLAERSPEIPLLQFDLRRCPLPSNLFDGAVLLNVLEHIDDHQRAMSEVVRVLKPGGVMHIEVPSNPDCYDIYDEKLMHFRRYRLAELKTMVEQLGCEVLRATHLGVFIYPAFWAVKQRNRRLLSLSMEEKARIVASQIRSTKSSSALSACMKLELLLGRIVSYPFGIRCVVSAKKL